MFLVIQIFYVSRNTFLDEPIEDQRKTNTLTNNLKFSILLTAFFLIFSQKCFTLISFYPGAVQ